MLRSEHRDALLAFAKIRHEILCDDFEKWPLPRLDSTTNVIRTEPFAGGANVLRLRITLDIRLPSLKK